MVKRSRTGCITCRIRRVKCDEVKPQCLKCRSSSRTCDGYLSDQSFIPRRQLVAALRNLGPVSQALSASQSAAASPAAQSTALSLSRSPSPVRVDSEFFDVFRHHTAPSTSSFLPSEFWGQRVLQLAHSEPAIWHAAVAVGALHRRFELHGQEPHHDSSYDAEVLTRRAHVHHGKALALAKDLNTAPKLMGLALTLMASANLLGRLDESQVHILASLRNVKELDKDPASGVDTMTMMLARMDMQAMTFSDSNSPYPYADAIKLQGPDYGLRDADQPIESYEQAASDIFAMLKRSMLIDEEFSLQEGGNNTYFAKFGGLLQHIGQWEAKMTQFEAKQPANAIHQVPALSVRLYHTLLKVIMKATMMGPETRWDPCLPHYERIIVLSREISRRRQGDGRPLLSLEMGLVVPLFSTAHRCRHRVVRRQAVALLRQLNCQEGMWSSQAALAAVRPIICIEEGIEDDKFDETMPQPNIDPAQATKQASDLEAALNFPWEAWHTREPELPGPDSWATAAPIPEPRRVKEILVVSRWEQRDADIKLLMGSRDVNMPFGDVVDKYVRY